VVDETARHATDLYVELRRLRGFIAQRPVDCRVGR
jgi:hypothetical protein